MRQNISTKFAQLVRLQATHKEIKENKIVIDSKTPSTNLLDTKNWQYTSLTFLWYWVNSNIEKTSPKNRNT